MSAKKTNKPDPKKKVVIKPRKISVAPAPQSAGQSAVQAATQSFVKKVALAPVANVESLPTAKTDSLVKSVLSKLDTVPVSENERKPSDISLGRMNASEADFEINLGARPYNGDSPSEMRATRPPLNPQPHNPDAPKEDLPADAIVAMRKSGGLRFTSRYLVVFSDGRATLRNDQAVSAGLSLQKKKLTKAQLNKIYRLISEVDFVNIDYNDVPQSPDSFAYEVDARLDTALHTLQVSDGRIPKALRPLLEALNKLLI